MNAVEKIPDVGHQIIVAVFHGLDTSTGKVTPVDAVATEDLNEYLTGILAEVDSQVVKRSFMFASEHAEFCAVVKQAAKERSFSTVEHGTILAQRLLKTEKETDDRYGHLGKSDNGVVKKGSFVQFLYSENGSVRYLAVKIDHQPFIDEDTFKKRLGLAIKDKVYKACRVRFDSALNVQDVVVYDNNSRPSFYWWSGFLELKAVRDDFVNTKTACEAVVSYLDRRLKLKHPVDHAQLRSAAIVRFRQAGVLNYKEFVDGLLGSYVPEDAALSGSLNQIVSGLLELPEKKGFDTAFELKPSEVKFKVAKIKVRSDVAIQYDEGAPNIHEKIWRERSSDGKILLVIHAEEGYQSFVEKARTP